MTTLHPALPRSAPGAARQAHMALRSLPAQLRQIALEGNVNDRRIRRALDELCALGRIPFIPSRRDMLAGVQYLRKAGAL